MLKLSCIKHYNRFVAEINQSIGKKELVCSVLNHKSNIVICKVLIRRSLIRGIFMNKSKNRFHILWKYDWHGLCAFSSMKVLKHEKRRFSSFLQLRALGVSHPAIDYIITTTCGVFSLKEITIYHCGGVALLKIF